MLDAVPVLTDINITQVPESIQRKLYDARQLQIQYHWPDHALFRLVLTASIRPNRTRRASLEAAVLGHPLRLARDARLDSQPVATTAAFATKAAALPPATLPCALTNGTTCGG